MHLYMNIFQLSEFCEELLCVGDDRALFNQLLFRSQKLSERRAEGEVVEETDEGKIVNRICGGRVLIH